MAESLHVSFDDGFGSIGNAWNVDASVPGEVRLAGQSAMMEWATGRDAGHGYGTYTVEAKLDGNEPGSAIIFWPGDNQWPGQELDLVETTPDGSGRQYGTVHWNQGGNDAYEPQVFDGVYGGVFHQYQMVWEPGRITYNVDGQQKAVFTNNVPVDFANGGMNNTIGFLNNNNNTSITVRDVTFEPLGGAASPAWSAPIEVPAVPAQPAAIEVAAVPVQAAASDDAVVWTPSVQEPVAQSSPDDPWSRWTDASGNVNWEAAAAHVTANYEATGSWFI